MSNHTDPFINRLDKINIKSAQKAKEVIEGIKCSICRRPIDNKISGGYVIGKVVVGPCCERKKRECPQMISLTDWVKGLWRGE